MFHYDAYLLTALLPIIIPNRDDGLNGDFMYFKQRRNYHKNLLRNIIEKFIIQNPFTRYLLSRKYKFNVSIIGEVSNYEQREYYKKCKNFSPPRRV